MECFYVDMLLNDPQGKIMKEPLVNSYAALFKNYLVFMRHEHITHSQSALLTPGESSSGYVHRCAQRLSQGIPQATHSSNLRCL